MTLSPSAKPLGNPESHNRDVEYRTPTLTLPSGEGIDSCHSERQIDLCVSEFDKVSRHCEAEPKQSSLLPCHPELVSGSSNGDDNAIAGLSWIIRGVGGVTSDQHLTGFAPLHPTENPRVRNDENKHPRPTGEGRGEGAISSLDVGQTLSPGDRVIKLVNSFVPFVKQVQGDKIFNDEMVVYPQPLNRSTVQPLNHPSLKKKPAFTLAEVLITLGIVGIVAAMTLPALVNKSQEYILKQQFKKVYNTWSNAVLKSYSDNGNSWYRCYYAENLASKCEGYDPVTGDCTKWTNIVGYSENLDCPAFFESLKSILKAVKVCENNAYANGCIPDMKGFDTVIAANSEGEKESGDYDVLVATSSCAAFREANIKNNNPAWVLSDGTVVGFYPGILGKEFWIDINGHKGPNKWGHDIFTFRFRGGDTRGVRIDDGVCMKAEKGGKTTTNMLKALY